MLEAKLRQMDRQAQDLQTELTNQKIVRCICKHEEVRLMNKYAIFTHYLHCRLYRRWKHQERSSARPMKNCRRNWMLEIM